LFVASVVDANASWIAGSALDAEAVRLVQPQGGGSGAVSVRGSVMSRAFPLADGDHRVSPLP
jgi:hypothetical protein